MFSFNYRIQVKILILLFLVRLRWVRLFLIIKFSLCKIIDAYFNIIFDVIETKTRVERISFVHILNCLNIYCQEFLFTKLFKASSLCYQILSFMYLGSTRHQSEIWLPSSMQLVDSYKIVAIISTIVMVCFITKSWDYLLLSF